MIKVSTVVGDGADLRTDAVVVCFYEKKSGTTRVAGKVDRTLKRELSAPLKSEDLVGKPGDIHTCYLSRNSRIPRAILLGLGVREELKADTLRRAAGNVGRLARRRMLKRVCMILPPLRGKTGVEDAAEAVTEGFVLGAYRAPTWKKNTEQNTEKKSGLPSLSVLVKDAGTLRGSRAGVRLGLAVSKGAWLARDLVNRPGNDLSPKDLAAAARKVARSSGLSCKVMGKAELIRMGAGGILAVGGGSASPPCLIQIEHKGGGAGVPTVCVVGKGITFDSGGISLKPSLNMDRMRYDMGGAAAVLGALMAAKALKLPLHVVGVIAAAENMPGSLAYRPGDVITLLDGTSVEVVNTDAEGRIILGDALAWALKARPDVIVDLATLTGACSVSLGSHALAMMTNDDTLASQMEAAGVESGERVWRLPLWKQYRTLVKSNVADLKNSGGREAGTIAAGIFLENFVDGHPWVHLDIAATAWSNVARDYRSKGATGVGVALLTRFMKRIHLE